MNKKILILGGAGFIGFYLGKKLAENPNNKITIVDSLYRLSGNKDTDLNILLSKNNIKFIKADLTTSDSFNNFNSFYDQIYMLAGIVGVDTVNNIPHEVIRVNTSIILNVLNWLEQNKCKKILFSSTSECYAGTVEKFDWEIPTKENVPLTIKNISHPRFTYAITKILGESSFINYSRAYDFECSIVRYHNVYGPRMGFKHVIPHIVERFYNKETPFQMYGHDQTRSFNFIDDAVTGTILAMEKGGNGDIYHIGDDTEISIETLIKFVGELMNYKGPYLPAESFSGSVARRCPNISKAKKQLDYSPIVNWKNGVKKTVTWYVDFLSNKKNNHESYYIK